MIQQENIFLMESYKFYLKFYYPKDRVIQFHQNIIKLIYSAKKQLN